MLGKSAMYNLKVSTGASVCGTGPSLTSGGPCQGMGAGLLVVDPQGATPRTPEILNSLIAMSNPMDTYQISSLAATSANSGAPDLNSPTGGVSDSSSCSGSVTSPPSVQHTRSQLIKEGLKLTLQTKRRQCSGDNTNTDEDEDSNGGKRLKKDELTAEDEERRRRRRERNKVAATKCRIKKRERTVNLVQESEILESQNYELKSQIQELETQRRRLVDMLSTHTPTCTRSSRGSGTGSPNAPENTNTYGSFDTYSTPAYCCPSPGDTPTTYDMIGSPYQPLEPYCDPSRVLTPLDPMVNARSSTPLPGYYPVTKHEVHDEHLLAGFNDDLTTLADSPFSCGPTSVTYCQPAVTPHHISLAHPTPAPPVLHHQSHVQQQSYCRPATACPSGLENSADTAYQVYQQDGFGLDSGCMA